MKILRQILIFFTICTAGELLGQYISFPGSVLSLVILLILLLIGIIKTHHIKETAEFLLDNMAFFFIPPSIGIMDSFFKISNSIVPILFIILASTVLTFAATAFTVSGLMKFLNQKKEKDE